MGSVGAGGTAGGSTGGGGTGGAAGGSTGAGGDTGTGGARNSSPLPWKTTAKRSNPTAATAGLDWSPSVWRLSTSSPRSDVPVGSNRRVKTSRPPPFAALGPDQATRKLPVASAATAASPWAPSVTSFTRNSVPNPVSGSRIRAKIPASSSAPAPSHTTTTLPPGRVATAGADCDPAVVVLATT